MKNWRIRGTTITGLPNENEWWSGRKRMKEIWSGSHPAEPVYPRKLIPYSTEPPFFSKPKQFRFIFSTAKLLSLFFLLAQSQERNKERGYNEKAPNHDESPPEGNKYTIVIIVSSRSTQVNICDELVLGEIAISYAFIGRIATTGLHLRIAEWRQTGIGNLIFVTTSRWTVYCWSLSKRKNEENATKISLNRLNSLLRVSE